MTKRMGMTAAAALALALIGAARNAGAQGQPHHPGLGPAKDPSQRDGLMIGFGVHAGNLSAKCSDQADCDNVLEAGGVNFHVGWFLQPRLAVMFDFWTMAHSEDRWTIHQEIATAAAQFWVIPRLWLKGGLGGANAGYNYKGRFVSVRDRTEKVFGVLFGAGYEVWRKRRFVMDVSFRYGTGFYDDAEVQAHNAGVGVELNWY